MKIFRWKTLALAPFVLFAAFYLFVAMLVFLDDRRAEPHDQAYAQLSSIAIFGASGTAGDGILKAAIDNTEIQTIYVVTRRITPRMKSGISAGKVHVIQHMDYLNYEEVLPKISKVDAVYWAIGISSLGADRDTYRRIHTDFPAQFIKEWLSLDPSVDASFQFISSSDISDESTTMWVQEKIRAEKTLFDLVKDSRIRIVAYRPDYIGATTENATLIQSLLYGFFLPVRSAVKATQIGQAMMEVSARGAKIESGTKLSNSAIIRYSDAYAQRQQ